MQNANSENSKAAMIIFDYMQQKVLKFIQFLLFSHLYLFILLLFVLLLLFYLQVVQGYLLGIELALILGIKIKRLDILIRRG